MAGLPRLLILAMALVLTVEAVSCGDDSPGGSDAASVPAQTDTVSNVDEAELLEVAIAALTPEGAVFHTVSRDYDVGQREDATTSEIWIAGDPERYRIEEKRESGFPTISIGESWEYTSLEDEDSLVESAIREDERGRYGSPIATVMRHLWWWRSAAEHGSVEQVEGGEKIVVEVTIDGAIGEADPEVLAGVRLRIEMEGDSLWPIRVETDALLVAGGSVTVSTTEFEGTELIPDDKVPADLFDRDVLRDLHVTFEEKIEMASEIGHPVFWLGRRHENTGLELVEIHIREQGQGPTITMNYATEEFRSSRLQLLVYQGGWAWRDHVSRIAKDAHQENLFVGDYPAVLTIGGVGSDSHSLMWVVDGTRVVELMTYSYSGREGERNPFNNPEAIIELASQMVELE